MAVIASIPSVSLTPGTRTLVANVPTGMVQVQFAVIRTLLVPSPTLNINWIVTISLDGGVNFIGLCSGANEGSNTDTAEVSQTHGLLRIQRDIDGLIFLGASIVPVGWTIVPGWEPTNTNRQLKVVFTNNETAVLAAELRVT